jgi:serine/threonine protein phosphatase PrpC
VHQILVTHENHEPKGSGEDAPPIWIHRPDGGLVGALDGMGGAGGELIKPPDEDTERTGAWVASRRAQAVVRAVYIKMIEQTRSRPSASASDDVYDHDQMNGLPAIRHRFDFTAEVREAIKADLAEVAAQTHAGGSGRLRSKMIKTLPTTLAVAWYDLSEHEYTAVWAGDSRVYCLHPEPDVGLQQATTDDLKTNADAMENLIADALMSNCVSASADFVLHERRLQLPPRCVLLAATDGCFGYVRTPLHFEHLLLSTMQQARGWHEWQEKLTAGIVQITGDDSTLSAAVIGWPDFAACQDAYASRFDWCAKRVQAYDARLAKVDEMERALGQAREELATTRRQLWEEYRKTYERLGDAPTRHVPAQLGEPGGNQPAKPRPAREQPGDDGEKSR